MYVYVIFMRQTGIKIIIVFAIGMIFPLTGHSQEDSSKTGKNQLGFSLIGPVVTLNNLMVGKPVWHDAPYRFWYTRQLTARLYIRTEFFNTLAFDLNDQSAVMNDFSTLDSVPPHNHEQETQLNVLKGRKHNYGFNLGCEWIPLKHFRYLSLVNGLTWSKENAMYYTRIQHTYTQNNTNGTNSITGTEYYYRITNLHLQRFGGFSQLRFIYPIHQQVSVSLDAYLYWNRTYYDRLTYLNFQDDSYNHDQYKVFETFVRLSAGIAVFF